MTYDVSFLPYRRCSSHNLPHLHITHRIASRGFTNTKVRCVCYLSVVLTGVASPHVRGKVCKVSEKRKQGIPRPSRTSSFLRLRGQCLERFVGVRVLHDDPPADTGNTRDQANLFCLFFHLKQIPGSPARPSWSAAPPSPCLPSGCSITAVISHVNSFTLPLIRPFITPPPVALRLRGRCVSVKSPRGR